MFGIGATSGVGVALKKNGDGSVAVGGLAPGGPAQANGVRVDDVIEQVRCNRRKEGSFITPSFLCVFPWARTLTLQLRPLAPFASTSG